METLVSKIISYTFYAIYVGRRQHTIASTLWWYSINIFLSIFLYNGKGYVIPTLFIVDKDCWLFYCPYVVLLWISKYVQSEPRPFRNIYESFFNIWRKTASCSEHLSFRIWCFMMLYFFVETIHKVNRN